MLESRPLHQFTFRSGYFNTDRLNYPDGAMAEGSENFLYTGADALRVWRGIKATGNAGGRTLFQVANGYAALTDNGMAQGIGSIFNFINESLFWIGEGKVVFNGTQLVDSTPSATDFTATANLQLSPKNGSNTYVEAYTAGMDQPDAPLVFARDASGSFTGLLDGLYSFKIARVRSETGGRSIASATSAVVLCEEQTVRLTFPLADSNGQDRWAIFATKAGFGGTGVHYLVEEIDDTDLSTIDSVARSYVLEFNDSDLLPVVSWTDDYPPPAGSFAGRLENYIAVVGCYDNAIATSIRNFPESFNPEHLAFLPKAPTAVLPDLQGSYMYVATPTSVHALSVAPGIDNPMILQTVWSDTGIDHPHNWCAYENIVFAFVSRQGAVTMDALGQPSTEFAAPVAKEMRDWDVANTRVFACPDLNSVVYANNGKCYLFNLQNRKWSSPCLVSDFSAGEIVSGVVINRRLQLCLLDGSAFDLYEFDEQGEAYRVVGGGTSISTTDTTVFVSGGDFSAADVGKRIVITDTNTDFVDAVIVSVEDAENCTFDPAATGDSLLAEVRVYSAATVDFKAVVPDTRLNPSGRANLLGIKAEFAAGESGDFYFDLFCDYATSAVKTLTHAAPADGMQTTVLTRWNQPRKETVRVEFRGSQTDFTKDCHPSVVTVFGTAEESNRVN